MKNYYLLDFNTLDIFGPHFLIARYYVYSQNAKISQKLLILLLKNVFANFKF